MVMWPHHQNQWYNPYSYQKYGQPDTAYSQPGSRTVNAQQPRQCLPALSHTLTFNNSMYYGYPAASVYGYNYGQPSVPTYFPVTQASRVPRATTPGRVQLDIPELPDIPDFTPDRWPELSRILDDLGSPSPPRVKTARRCLFSTASLGKVNKARQLMDALQDVGEVCQTEDSVMFVGARDPQGRLREQENTATSSSPSTRRSAKRLAPFWDVPSAKRQQTAKGPGAPLTSSTPIKSVPLPETCELLSPIRSHVTLHPCSTCTRQFYSDTELRAHRLQLHGGHTCDVCGASFPRRSNLVSHKKIHPRPSVCHLCGACLAKTSDFYKHMRHAHGYPC